ncbi:MAG: hypothetical protein ACU84Q_16360 [Gammaproteobacteria bacterium]
MKIALWITGIAVIAVFLFALYFVKIMNPAVVAELKAEPNGARAKIVMLLSFPSGKQLPVNYLRDGNLVYAGADFGWWRELNTDDSGVPVTMLIQGQNLHGTARAILDQPQYRDEIFARLRPTAPNWLPDWAKAVLVEIETTEQK